MYKTAPNSGYAVRYRSLKPFATLRASHTRKTLGDIVEWEHEEERSHHWMDCQQI